MSTSTQAELSAAYECIDELTGVIKGLLGLTVMIGSRPDIPADLREALNSNHRIATAYDAIADQVAS